jgi:hypothetical protein
VRRHLLPAITVLVVAAATIVTSPVAAVAGGHSGHAYRVDCSGGSDDSDGRDGDRPWASLDRVNQQVFRPGDRILLRRGTTCTGVLAPRGSGTAGVPILVGAYGHGAKPRVVGDGGLAAVHLYNVQGWELSDLDVSNLGPAPAAGQGRYGVLIQLDDFGVGAHYVVDRVDVHDVNGCDCQDRHSPVPSGGVIIWASGHTVPTGFHDVIVQHSSVHDVAAEGIATESTWQRRPEFPSGPGSTFVPITGLVVRHNQVTDVAGDGIGVFAARGALVEHNVVRGFSGHSQLYRTGIGVGNADDTVIQFNDVSGGQGPLPAQAFAIDHAASRTAVQYNLSRGNSGGTLLFCSSTGETSAGNLFRFNISQDDEATGAYPFGTPLAVFNVPCPLVGDLSVYGNTVYTTRAATMIANRLSLPVRFTDNILVGPPSGAVILDTAPTYDHNLYLRVAPPATDLSPVLADPLLVAPGTATGLRDAGGYRLRPGSPALGAGVPVPVAGPRDYFGTRLPAAVWNIGADQADSADQACGPGA